MKAIRIFFRNIKSGFKSVGRNLSLSVASISCITITLLIVAISLLLAANVENMTKVIKEDFTIVAFIKYDTKEDDIEKTISKIKNYSNVDSVERKTKSEIATEMKKTSKTLSSIIDTWDEEENPLYDTLQVKVKDQEKISKTAKKLENELIITEVSYGKGMVENLLSIFKVIEKVMIVATISLVLVTLFLISNTIKITIFSRKREIEIMRLVGASNFSIKQPFTVEGFCLGLIGSIIPIICVLYGYSAFYSEFNGHMFSPIIELVKPEPFIYLLALIILVLGIVVGMFGSKRAVRKYLKI